MDFSESRNVSLGVYYRIWGIMRQNGWWNQYDGVALDADTRTGAPANSYFYTDNPRPFVFIKDDNEVATDSVVVYVNGVAQNPNTYTVDYINGRVTFNSAVSGNVSADLAIFEVIVREGYPEDEELKLLDLPVIAYQLEKDDRSSYAVGLAPQKKARFITVSLMARNEGERQDLVDCLATFLRFVAYVDYTAARPLDQNQGLDSSFSYADQFVNRMIILGRIEGDYLRPRPGGSDKERFRAMIAFECERIS